MALIKCEECKKDVSSKAAFCPHCGNPMQKNDIETKENKKLEWNFNNKLIAISFWICAICLTYLFTSPGLFNELRFPMLDNHLLNGTIAIVIGIVLFIFKFKNFSLNQEINEIKKLKLTKNQISLIVILSGIIIMLQIGTKSISGAAYVVPILGFMTSFFLLIATILFHNWKKLKSVSEFICLSISIFSFIVTGLFYTYGNEMNNDAQAKVESFFEYGNANPGDTYINYAIATLIIAIISLILFFAIRTKKEKQ